MSSIWQSLWMLYCWLQLGLYPALFPFTGLCEGAGFEKPPPCRQQIRSCRYIFITKEQKHPPGTLASFCRTAEEGALCTSPKPPPTHGIITPKCHFPRPRQLSWTGSVASAVLKSFILSGASILMIFSILFFSRLTFAPHRSVQSILSLLCPHKIVPRFCQNMLREKLCVFINCIFFSSSVPPWHLCPAGSPSTCSATNPQQKRAPSHMQQCFLIGFTTKLSVLLQNYMCHTNCTVACSFRVT